MYHISGRERYIFLSVDIFEYLIGDVLVFLISCKRKFMHDPIAPPCHSIKEMAALAVFYFTH